ncbi:MAG: ankyrin repeat domain-containing protein [Holosporaceae bacterium]|jgi:ankyrin repeat protein|nr:ankyrin repeat domain-containing protein [Holosporaceae bacterium]
MKKNHTELKVLLGAFFVLSAVEQAGSLVVLCPAPWFKHAGEAASFETNFGINRELLKTGQNSWVNWATWNNEKPLVYSSVRYDGNDVNSIDCYGRTPVHIAAYLKDKDMVIFLINEGANVFAIGNSRKLLLLDLDIWRNGEGMLDFLVGECGVNINGVKDGETPLDIAVRLRDENAIYLLRSRGAKRLCEL